MPTLTAAMPLPTTDEEIWRYSRIGELDLERYTTTPLETAVRGVDGSGVRLLGAHDHPLDPGALEVIGGEAPDVFATLNVEHASATVLQVPAGIVVAQPIVVTHRVPGGLAAVFPRLVIDAGANSEITVVEVFDSAAGAEALAVPVLQIRAAQAARVRYLAVNELGERVWSIGNQQAVGARDSDLLLATVALGGEYARVRTDVRLSGRGANARQIALYFAGGDQMHDFRTVQDHDAPYTTSDLLFKGAVQDRSRSVYTGLIKIREHARGSAAYQTNRNLTLSEGAWAESVPNLEIETNDVTCSHASTVGPIDEDQRFYLESRGIRPEVAERLVVLGFFDEVLAQLPTGELAADLRSRVAAKLSIGTTDGGDPR